MVDASGTEPFTAEDLLLAAEGAADGSYLSAWSSAVFTGLEMATMSRPGGEEGWSLLHLIAETGRYQARAVHPFQGMLEAPDVVVSVYQTHGSLLGSLVDVRDEVLEGLLLDLVTRFMDGPGAGLRWGDLTATTAIPPKPETPAYDDDPDSNGIGLTVEQAADAADEFLADPTDADPVAVVRDPHAVLQNDEVFVFARDQVYDDDQILVVDKATGEVRLVVWPAWEENPFADLTPLQEDDEEDEDYEGRISIDGE